MPKNFQSPSGMHDIFGEQYDYFERIREVFFKVAKIYGFEGIETPVMENIKVFTRGVGEHTDIVEKEMYSFKTKGGDQVALRPEGTAGIARSYIEHNLYTRTQPIKFFYFAPFFRYERPQAGRYRQFWQFGLETIGKESPVLDAQIIAVMYNVFQELGIKDLVVEINSMGDSSCREEFEKVLKKHFKKENSSLCADCKKRIKKNPLRVLDCKKCIKVKESAPQIVDYLCIQCRDDFKKVLEYLEELNIPYDLNSFLVRGLDYYTNTVYEFFASGSEERLALGGGGRYDGLINLLGGEETPATGAAMGVERTILSMKENEIKVEKETPRVFIAQLSDLAKRKCLKLFEEFRKANVPVSESFGQGSLKRQMNKANKMNAEYVLIMGEEEAVEDRIIIRDMQSGQQENIKTKEAVKEIKKKLK